MVSACCNKHESVRSLYAAYWNAFILIFTVRNEVAKVMLLHVCVCPQGGSTWAGTPPDQGHPPDLVYPQEPGTPLETATVADGGHPTGMHSCCQCLPIIVGNVYSIYST